MLCGSVGWGERGDGGDFDVLRGLEMLFFL